MHPELHRARQAIQETIRNLNPGQMSWHPEGKWSATEVLEHLCIAFSGTVRGLQRCLDSGAPSATPPSLYQRFGKALVVDIGYFPPGRPAPDFTKPKGKPCEQVQAEILQNLDAMDEVLRRCEQDFGAFTKLVDHPVLGAFSVRDWRRFHRIHTLHHMKQIARLRRQMPRGAAAGVPSGSASG